VGITGIVLSFLTLLLTSSMGWIMWKAEKRAKAAQRAQLSRVSVDVPKIVPRGKSIKGN
jgi:uncharacterized membrane protein